MWCLSWKSSLPVGYFYSKINHRHQPSFQGLCLSSIHVEKKSIKKNYFFKFLPLRIFPDYTTKLDLSDAIEFRAPWWHVGYLHSLH